MDNEISRYEAAWKALGVMIRQKKAWKTNDLLNQLNLLEREYRVGSEGELLYPGKGQER